MTAQRAREPYTKRQCPSCPRKITETPAGSLRYHRRSNGDSCPGDNGICATCGRAVPLYPDGTVRPHKELRVRRSKNRSPDGLLAVEPETYSSKRDCKGAGEKPEVA